MGTLFQQAGHLLHALSLRYTGVACLPAFAHRCFCAKSRGFSSDISQQNTLQETSDHITKATNVIVMAGAGISTPSGIPDFRTPGTGLYSNLQKYNLPYPEAIFDIDYFMMDQRPFMSLAQDLYPGQNYRPNMAHYFVRLLHQKGKLLRMYTQNIDGLERLAGIPEEKLVEAHGTFASASCTLCSEKHDAKWVMELILDGTVPKCQQSKCKGVVKPDIVFFGEMLPPRFWIYYEDTAIADFLLVMGTSLEVYPFASIADAVSYKAPRVLINRNVVGSFGSRDDDSIFTGDLEEGVKKLASAVGWLEDLEELYKSCEKSQIHS